MEIPAWSLETLELSERGLHLLFAGFLALWTIALGASIGSFLNVVIYRMPRRMSLVHPKSRCPACETPIRAADNIPILAWLRLGGRCRACGAPISARYPLVEGLVAILLFALVWCEVYSGGINLPGSQSDRLVTNPLLWRFNLAHILRMAYHAYLLIVAVSIAYIAWDGFPPPRRLAILSLMLGILVPIVVPSVRPDESGIPLQLPQMVLNAGWNLVFDTNALLVAGVGLAGGLLAGGLLGIAATKRFDFAGVFCLTTLAGLYLGWQALTTYAPIAGILALINAGISRSTSRAIPATVACVLALIIQVFAWRWLDGVADGLADMWLSDRTRAFFPSLIAVMTTVILAGVARAATSNLPAQPVRNTKPHTQNTTES